jgi:hypothetical protein
LSQQGTPNRTGTDSTGGVVACQQTPQSCMPPSAGCTTGAICSTEERFFSTALPPVPMARLRRHARLHGERNRGPVTTTLAVTTSLPASTLIRKQFPLVRAFASGASAKTRLSSDGGSCRRKSTTTCASSGCADSTSARARCRTPLRRELRKRLLFSLVTAARPQPIRERLVHISAAS